MVENRFGIDQVLYNEEDDQMKKMTKTAADRGASIATNAATKLGTKAVAKLTTRKRKGFLGDWRTRRAEKKAAKKYEKIVEPYKGAAKSIVANKLEKELSDDPKDKQTTHSEATTGNPKEAKMINFSACDVLESFVF